MKKLRWLMLLLPALLASCDSEIAAPAVTESRSMTVVASNYPLYYFATRITEGVSAAPTIILPDIDGDPANWVPDAAQIELLQSATLIVLNGAGAESWLDLVTLDPKSLLDTAATISGQLIPLEEDVVHQHGPTGEHSHQGTAFTTWLDPDLASTQAATLAAGLSAMDPDNAADYQENLASLQADLQDLDTRLATVFGQLGDRPVVFSHPVYQYPSRRYGINAVSVHWEPGESPSTSDWVDLQQKLQNHPARLMIWEGAPLKATVERLAAGGLNSVTFEPAANRPVAGDYLDVMNSNIARLTAVLVSGSR